MRNTAFIQTKMLHKWTHADPPSTDAWVLSYSWIKIKQDWKSLCECRTCPNHTSDIKRTEVSCDNSLKLVFIQKHLAKSWLHIRSGYPELYDKVVKCMMPFPTMYICETGFSGLITVLEYWNKLDMEPDLRLKLSLLQPRHWMPESLKTAPAISLMTHCMHTNIPFVHWLNSEYVSHIYCNFWNLCICCCDE